MVLNLKFLRNNKGFTLIELLIVLIILAIALTIGAPNFFAGLQKERLEADQNAVLSLNDATESYALVSGTSLDDTATNFVFADCMSGGSYNESMMIDKLVQNGFMIAGMQTESEGAEFNWNTVTDQWELLITE